MDGAGTDGVSAGGSRRTVDRNSERRRVQLRRHRARDSLPRRAVPLCRGRTDDARQEYVDGYEHLLALR